jgi:hypothetical protein
MARIADKDSIHWLDDITKKEASSGLPIRAGVIFCSTAVLTQPVRPSPLRCPGADVPAAPADSDWLLRERRCTSPSIDAAGLPVPVARGGESGAGWWRRLG